MDTRERGIRISIGLEMPAPGGGREEDSHHECPPEDRIRRMLDLVESDHESAAEWQVIRRLNNKLMARRRNGTITDRELNILRMMQPVLQQFGPMDEAGVELDGELHPIRGGGRRHE
jgi:hypothetical protein